MPSPDSRPRAAVIEQAHQKLRLDSKLRISYDPEANALYVRLTDVQDSGFGETDVNEDGVIIDSDASGNARGYEFLSVRERGVPVSSLPGPVARALSEFVSAGLLEADEPVERQY
jgi:uncharacterized protein YuzE